MPRFRVVAFWGCLVSGSLRFGVVEIQGHQDSELVKIRGRRVLGSSSFGVVEFWAHRFWGVGGLSSLVVVEFRGH